MAARVIILDTETTGLDVDGGDRIVEIGCVELVDHIITGQVFHKYINPERDIPANATRIHGITRDMVKDMPKFSEVVDEFLEFISSSTLVIHNARFDIKFIEVELKRTHKNQKIENLIVDTLEVARKKFPGMPATLDALCKRFNISTQSRKFHGALKDAVLLSKVYVELCGGVQRSLSFRSIVPEENTALSINLRSLPKRVFALSESDRKAHRASISKIKNPIWSLYIDDM